MLRTLSLLTTIILSTTLHANNTKKAENQSSPSKQNYQDNYYPQTLNHSDPKDPRKFQQRYFIDSSAASNSNSPVILYIGNEAELGYLLNNSFVPEMAQKLKAHFIALEHRYYGKSQPFQILSVKNLSYLNYDNALQDIAQFQRFMRKEKGLRGKWIVVGQSYGANLAAFYKLKYPEQVVGALASSPALRSVMYWPEYDKHAAEKAGRECVKRYREKILLPIERALHNPNNMKEYKTMFDGNDIESDEEFVYTLSFMSDVMVSFQGSDKLCQSAYAVEPLAAYNKQFTDFMQQTHFRLIDFTDKGIKDLNAASYSQGMGQRQWAYHYCSEFGDLTVSNSDPAVSLISKAVPEDGLSLCRNIFGVQNPPNVEINNQNYYYPLLSKTTSNIMIVNGSEDPVLTLSISDVNGNNVNPNIIIHDIDGGAHHSELYTEKETDSAAIKQARQLEIDTFRKWVS